MPGPPSSVSRLPRDVREALHGWLNDPAVTQDEAAQLVNDLLARVAPEHPRISRRAVNRYDQKYREATRQIRESREVASRMVAELGSKPGGEIGNLLTEMIRSASFRITASLQEGALATEAVPALIKQLKDLSLISQRVESAGKLNEQRAKEVRERAAPEVAGGIARRASDEAGADRSVSVERLRQIARDVYGIQLQDESGARRQGLSEETADEIKRKVLGIDE